MDRNEQPTTSDLTRSVDAARAIGIENISEVMINRNKEQRNLSLEYSSRQQLQWVKNESEEQRNMRINDKRQQKLQWKYE